MDKKAAGKPLFYPYAAWLTLLSHVVVESITIVISIEMRIENNKQKVTGKKLIVMELNFKHLC